MRLRAGKLPPEVLGRILAGLPEPDPRVVVGPGLGRDAAVVEMAGGYLVLKTDPVTFATDAIGWYAVQINANDVACLGARPLWFMLTSLLPVGCDDALPETIARQVVDACATHEISFLGGHTEVTIGIDRPLLIGTMIGEVAHERLIRPGRARAGDAILLTKGVPLEGATIIARERREELLSRGVAPALIARAANFIRDPGIDVLREAALAAGAGASALHDPTEGGLTTGLWELCEAAGLGAVIEGDKIPVVPEGRELCAAFGLDPLGTIASGALLIAIEPSRAADLQSEIAASGIVCAQIGHLVERERSITLDGTPLREFAADEITRIFE